MFSSFICRFSQNSLRVKQMASDGKTAGWNGSVVSTVAGDGHARVVDGMGTADGVAGPYGIIQSGDAKSLIFSEDSSHRIDTKSVAIQHPRGLRVNPLNVNNFYFGDWGSIRYWDSAADQVTLIAGGETKGYADGVGPNARFRFALGVLCHPNGRTLYIVIIITTASE